MENSMKETMKNLALGMLAILYGWLGLTKARDAVMKLWIAGGSTIPTYILVNGVKTLALGGNEIDNNPLMARLIGLCLNGYKGVVALTTAQTKWNSGIKEPALKGIAWAILSGFGIVEGTLAHPMCRKNNNGLEIASVNKWLEAIGGHLEDTVLIADDEEDEVELPLDEEDEESIEDEVEDVVIKVATKKPKTGHIAFMMSFFALLSPTFNKAKEVVNYKWVNGIKQTTTTWRTNVEALAAIKAGEDTYQSGDFGAVKALRSVEAIIADKVTDGKTKISDMGHVLLANIVCQSLHFKIGGKATTELQAVFGDAWTGFITGGMKLIIAAVNNGADEATIGYGFSQYLDDEDISALHDEFALCNTTILNGEEVTTMKQLPRYKQFDANASKRSAYDWTAFID